MSRLGKSIILVAVVWFFANTVYASHRSSSILQLLTMPVALGFLVAFFASIVCIFIEWKQRRWRSLLPFIVCVGLIVISRELVSAIRERIFISCLPSYEAVVKQMESGQIAVSTNFMRSPQAEMQAKLAYRVFAEKNAKGVLTVEFLTEGGFPVMHSGYLYTSSGVIEPGSTADERWPIRYEKRPHWFYISD